MRAAMVDRRPFESIFSLVGMVLCGYGAQQVLPRSVLVADGVPRAEPRVVLSCTPRALVQSFLKWQDVVWAYRVLQEAVGSCAVLVKRLSLDEMDISRRHVGRRRSVLPVEMVLGTYYGERALSSRYGAQLMRDLPVEMALDMDVFFLEKACARDAKEQLPYIASGHEYVAVDPVYEPTFITQVPWDEAGKTPEESWTPSSDGARAALPRPWWLAVPRLGHVLTDGAASLSPSLRSRCVLEQRPRLLN